MATGGMRLCWSEQIAPAPANSLGSTGTQMTDQDRSYYLRRAEAELALAACAAHPAAMRAHYHLAGFYLDKAHGVRRSAPLETSSSDRPVEAA